MNSAQNAIDTQSLDNFSDCELLNPNDGNIMLQDAAASSKTSPCDFKEIKDLELFINHQYKKKIETEYGGSDDSSSDEDISNLIKKNSKLP